MKLAIIQNLYSNYIDDFQQRNSDKLISYESCLNVLHEESFAWNGVWGKELSKLGIEVVDIYLNYEKLNFYWCQENNVSFENTSIEEIVFLQLKNNNVEAILNTDVKILKTPFIKKIKTLRGFKAAFAHVCSPYFSHFDLTEYNAIFSCVHHYVDLFKSYGIASYYLSHSFNPEILSKIEKYRTEEKINKIFFAGGIIKGQDLHDDREKLLISFVENQIPLSFFSELFFYSKLKSSGVVIAKKAIYRIIQLMRFAGVPDRNINKIPILKEGLSWKFIPGDLVNNKLLSVAEKPLYGLNLFSEMQNYLISLNIHAGAARDEAANMRLFEATGVGTALLTDYKSNLSNFFELDSEVVAYRTIPEAIEKAKFLMANPSVAIEIGKAAQIRILKDHTFANRAPILGENILKHLSN